MFDLLPPCSHCYELEPVVVMSTHVGTRWVISAWQQPIRLIIDGQIVSCMNVMKCEGRPNY